MIDLIKEFPIMRLTTFENQSKKQKWPIYKFINKDVLVEIRSWLKFH